MLFLSPEQVQKREQEQGQEFLLAWRREYGGCGGLFYQGDLCHSRYLQLGPENPKYQPSTNHVSTIY